MQNHVDVVLFSKAHDLVESLPTVIATMEVTLVVSDMAVSGYKDSNSIRSCISLLAIIHCRSRWKYYL